MDLHAAFVQSVANVVQISLEMVHGYVMVLSHGRSLEDGPDALYRIGVDIAPNELLGLVLHGLVLVGQVVQPLVGTMLVGVDRAAVDDMLVDLFLHHVRARTRHGQSHDVSLSLAHSQDCLLANPLPSEMALPGFVLVELAASDIFLVVLHYAREKRLLVAARLLDPLEHVPGRLLRPVQLLGELQRGDALARHADLVHHEQPLPNGYLRRFHDRAHLARELLAAILAVVVALAGVVPIGVRTPAFRAESAVRPATRLEEPYGFVLVGDPAQKIQLSHCRVVRHCQSSPASSCLCEVIVRVPSWTLFTYIGDSPYGSTTSKTLSI